MTSSGFLEMDGRWEKALWDHGRSFFSAIASRREDEMNLGRNR